MPLSVAAHYNDAHVGSGVGWGMDELIIACVCCRSLSQLHHLRSFATHYPLDQRRQRFKRLLLLSVIFVSVVDATNAGNDMTKASLSNIGINTSPAHQAAGCAP